MKASAITRNAALTPGSVRRIVWAALTVIAVVVALWLQNAADRRAALAQDAATQRAWQNDRPPGTPLPLASVSSRFAIRTAGTGELAWQAAGAAGLIASLKALDATDTRLAQVKVTRNGSAGFTVTAERAP